MKHEYSVQIVWSNEDGAYVAQIPELPGCLADGQTQEEALRNIAVVANEWIEVAREGGRPIPPPMSVEDIEALCRKKEQEFNAWMNDQLNQAVRHVVDQFLSQQQQCAYNLQLRSSLPTVQLETAGGSRHRR